MNSMPPTINNPSSSHTQAPTKPPTTAATTPNAMPTIHAGPPTEGTNSKRCSCCTAAWVRNNAPPIRKGDQSRSSGESAKAGQLALAVVVLGLGVGIDARERALGWLLALGHVDELD